jgi:cytochrome b561
MNTTNDVANCRYGVVAQALHWLTVAMVTAQFVLIDAAEGTPLETKNLKMLGYHKSVGETVFVLSIVRLIWRATHPPPALPLSIPKLQRTLAHLTHGAFYCLLFAIPMSGLLISFASGKNIDWFGHFTIPSFVAPSKIATKIFAQMHASLAAVLFFTVLVHIAAALKHHLWDKDQVLNRMLPRFITKK